VSFNYLDVIKAILFKNHSILLYTKLILYIINVHSTLFCDNNTKVMFLHRFWGCCMGGIHKLWHHEYKAKQVIRYFAYKSHSLDKDFVMFLVLRGLKRSRTANGVKCPFCNVISSKAGLELHILCMHYDEILQLVDEYYKMKLER